jgi:hypothetical protein
MIMRQVMRKFVNKGIDAGLNKASSMRKGAKQPPQGAVDDFLNPAENGPSRNEVRAARRAKRENGN